MNLSITQAPIKGTEIRDGVQTPIDALVAFYDAFNHRKLSLMEENWAHRADIAMDNPLGGIMRGWANIREVYKRIFEGQAKVYVEFYDYSLHESADTFYVVGRERGEFSAHGQTVPLAIRTSRIYRKIDGMWKQVHHHGSIEDPILLSTYQQLVKA